MNSVSKDPLAKERLKAWVRLLRTTRHAENQLREYLRSEHTMTLPQFDVMAALYRADEGLTMSELSRALLVSNGNSTTIVDRLERDGLVARTPLPTDRRTIIASLTDAGRAQFRHMAEGHERAVNTLFQNLDHADLDALVGLLRKADVQ